MRESRYRLLCRNSRTSKSYNSARAAVTVGYLPAIVYPDTEALQPVLRNPHPLRHIRTNPINGTRKEHFREKTFLFLLTLIPPGFFPFLLMIKSLVAPLVRLGTFLMLPYAPLEIPLCQVYLPVYKSVPT